MSYAARIGTAFHNTVEDLNRKPQALANAEAAARARELFSKYLDEETKKADRQPRERFLPRDNDRINRAMEAAIREAQRIASVPRGEHMTPSPGGKAAAESEITVSTSDSLLRGRVDRVERGSHGMRLVDYKSALTPEVSEKYETQLLLYSYMWHDTFGEWPNEAYVVFPLLGISREIAVSAERCTAATDNARTLAEYVTRDCAPSALAQVGESCRICDFRPWCRPFWIAQSRDLRSDSVLQTAYWGFEAGIQGIQHTADKFVLELGWGERRPLLSCEDQRFAHLHLARPGWTVRALEWHLQGLRLAPRAAATSTSEIFLIPANE